MGKHLQHDLDQLKQNLLGIGALVEESVNEAIMAFKQRRADLCQKVIAADDKIDRREVEIEEECLKLLALHQPVAEDLRFIAAVIKINNDLERMGDYAVKIAQRTLHLLTDPPIATPPEFDEMTKVAQEMVRLCLDAIVKRDVTLAREICKMDDRVDEIDRAIIKELRHIMSEQPALVDQSLDVFSATRRVERIADLATNIAQDVIYIVEGAIVRHGLDRRSSPRST